MASHRASAPPAAGRPGKARKASPLLAIAFVISLALHAALLAIHFTMPKPKPPERDRGLEVVLVNARHARAPENADVLAQANVDGGGTTEEAVRPKTPLPAQDNNREGDALVEAKKRTTQTAAPRQEVITRKEAPAQVAVAPAQPEAAKPELATSGLDLLDSAAAIARLEAQIDRRLEEYAKRPRKKFIGARAREYRFAQYVEDWRQKIERVGTLNYPEAARGRLYGSLLLYVAIRADGSLERVEVQRSSGQKVLDEAAVNIVKLSAPFAPFPPDIRTDTDVLEIVRTWTFTNSDRVRTE